LIAADGRIVRVNRSLCTLLGFGANELIGRAVQDLTHPADLPEEEVRRQLVLERRVIVDRGTWRLARGDGSYLRVGASASLVDATDGADACLLWHLTDAPEDLRGTGGGVLAGPPGQRAFERAVRHQLLRCRRYGEQAALVRCSLHGLPEVRSSHGPETADKLVAGILDGVRRRCAGPTSSPTWATRRSRRCSLTPTWTRPRRRPTPSATPRRTCASRPRGDRSGPTRASASPRWWARARRGGRSPTPGWR
jgi:PAS domain S-box-containing protein